MLWSFEASLSKNKDIVTSNENSFFTEDMFIHEYRLVKGLELHLLFRLIHPSLRHSIGFQSRACSPGHAGRWHCRDNMCGT